MTEPSQETAPVEQTNAEQNGDNSGQQTSDAVAKSSSSSSGQAEAKLYIGNLPDDCQKHQLQEIFEKYGHVTQCDRVKNFAFVHMVGLENAQKAIKDLDDSAFMGTHIQVQLAKSKGKPSEDECFNCGKNGHWAKDCPTSRRSYGSYGRDRYAPYGRDRPPPYSGYGHREPYGRPPPRDYGDYRRPPPPARDYYGSGQSGYRSRSPVGYTGTYEGYGAPRGYGGRRY